MNVFKRSPLITLMILLVPMLALFACSDKASALTVAELPVGDATHGKELFSRSINGSPPCSTCHKEQASSTGPSLVNYGSKMKEHGDAVEYTLESIIKPAKHLVRGYSNMMYAHYGDKLSAQHIADLIAYLLN